VRVIPNGVAMPSPPSTTRRQLLAELGLPEQSRIIGLVGRLWAQKRIKDAIWAADLLKVIRGDVHLLIIGDGPQRDRLRRFRDQVCISGKVHFLGQRGDVPQLLPHFDVLWSTSGYEGQSNAILEAMASGVPVVATDIPGTRELVVSDVTGYLVPVGDRAGFARRTERLLNDTALAGRFSAAARKRVESEFSVEKMVERHATLYRELL
jgi:glycosyltransferase involved in cell wall biosynthesis